MHKNDELEGSLDVENKNVPAVKHKINSNNPLHYLQRDFDNLISGISNIVLYPFKVIYKISKPLVNLFNNIFTTFVATLAASTFERMIHNKGVKEISNIILETVIECGSYVGNTALNIGMSLFNTSKDLLKFSTQLMKSYIPSRLESQYVDYVIPTTLTFGVANATATFINDLSSGSNVVSSAVDASSTLAIDLVTGGIVIAGEAVAKETANAIGISPEIPAAVGTFVGLVIGYTTTHMVKNNFVDVINNRKGVGQPR